MPNPLITNKKIANKKIANKGTLNKGVVRLTEKSNNLTVRGGAALTVRFC